MISLPYAPGALQLGFEAISEDTFHNSYILIVESFAATHMEQKSGLVAALKILRLHVALTSTIGFIAGYE